MALFVLLVVLFCSKNSTLAEITKAAIDPSEAGVGSRPLGLGRAFIGQADDCNAIFLNPAGLMNSHGLQMTTMYTRLMNMVSYSLVGATVQTAVGPVGFGYVGASIGDSYTTTRDLNTDRVIPAGGVISYSSSVFLFSYANSADKLPLIGSIGGFENVFLGSTLKIFNQTFSGANDASARGIDLDIGLLYKPIKSLSIGLSQLDTLPASLGGKMTWSTGIEEGIPSQTKLGISTKLIGKDSLFNPSLPDLTLNIDADVYSTKKNRPMLFHAGLEFKPVELLTLRFGIDQDAVSKGANTIGVSNNFAAGVGLSAFNFQFDYAYHQYDNLEENNTHYFSLSYIEPEKKAGGEKGKTSIKNIPVEPVPPLSPIPRVKTFSDVKEGSFAKEAIEKLASAGVLSGYPDGTFKPERGITRGEFAALLTKVKKPYGTSPQKPPFKDVSEKSALAKYISSAVSEGLMAGYPDGTFKPNKAITRAEGVAILTELDSTPVPEAIDKSPYSDVPLKHWAVRNIQGAKDYGLLNFIKENKFEPGKPLTRAETATILYRTDTGQKLVK